MIQALPGLDVGAGICDTPLIDEESRRYAQLAKLLRIRTVVEVDSWSNVHGQPLRPGLVYDEIVRRTNIPKEELACSD